MRVKRFKLKRSDRPQARWCAFTPDGKACAISALSKDDLVSNLHGEWKWDLLEKQGWKAARVAVMPLDAMKELKMLRELAETVLEFRDCVESNRPGMSVMNRAVGQAKNWRNWMEAR